MPHRPVTEHLPILRWEYTLRRNHLVLSVKAPGRFRLANSFLPDVRSSLVALLRLSVATKPESKHWPTGANYIVGLKQTQSLNLVARERNAERFFQATLIGLDAGNLLVGLFGPNLFLRSLPLQ
jgi:hypothetical protein